MQSLLATPCISRLFFRWLNPLLVLGAKRPLEQRDIDGMQAQLPDWRFIRSRDASAAFEVSSTSAPTLLCCGRSLSDASILMLRFYRTMRPTFWLGAALITAQQIVVFLLPITLSQMLQHLDTPAATSSITEGLALSSALFFLACAKTLLENHYYLTMQRCGIRCMAMASVAVFQKTMCLTPQARGALQSGKVVNLLQIDARRFYDTSWFWHLQWASGVQVITSTGLLFWLLGPSFLAGFAVMMLMLPLNAVAARRQSSLAKAVSKATDVRMDLMAQIVGGIRAIKVASWEQPFLRKLQAARVAELDLVRRLQVARAYANVIGQVTPAFVALAAILTYVVVAGQALVPHKIFTALALFEQIKEPFARIPRFIAAMIDLRVSATRLAAFLREDEVTTLPPLLEDGKGGRNMDASGKGKTNVLLELRPCDCGWAMSKSALAEPCETAGTVEEEDGSTTDAAPSLTQTALRWVRRGRRKRVERAGVTPLLDEGSVPSSSSTAAAATAAHAGIAIAAAEGSTVDGDKTAHRSTRGRQKQKQAHLLPVLHDVHLQVPRAGLVVVCGGVASGKTSLLHALLSELHYADSAPRHRLGIDTSTASFSSSLRVASSPGAMRHARCKGVALVAQDPWIVNGTVRQNILLGAGVGMHGDADDVDEERYAAAIRRAQLADDLKALPAGDETEIGERGINLSGGQKQRVGLARVVFSGARLCVLDDPLSALDANMGRKIFDELISGKDGGGMARVVAASAPPTRLLRAADVILLLRAGRIVARGTFAELAASGELRGIACDEAGDADGARHDKKDRKGQDDVCPVDVPAGSKTRGVGLDKSEPQQRGKGRLVSNEDRETGVVKCSVWAAFVRAAGPVGVAVVLVGYVLGAAAFVGQSVWLAAWSTASLASTVGGTNVSSSSGGTGGGGSASEHHIVGALGYSGFACAVLLLSLLRYLLQAHLAVRASTRLHARMVSATLRAPLAWFDTTPSGRILNRFGRDCRTLDLDVWQAVTRFLDLLCSSAVSLLLVVSITPLFAAFLPPIFWVFFKLQGFYRSSSRELKRLLAVSRSPLYNFFSGILPLNGLATIRAFRLQPRFATENNRLCDASNAVQYVSKAADRWLGTRFELIGNVLLLGACISTIQAKAPDGSNAAFLALCLTSTMTMARGINYTLRTFVQAESEMTSVERVLHFATNLPAEKYTWGSEDGSAVDITTVVSETDASGAMTAATTVESRKQATSSLARKVFDRRGGPKKTGASKRAPLLLETARSSSVEEREVSSSGDVVVEVGTGEAGQSEFEEDRQSTCRGATLQFENVRMQYRPGLPFALDGVSFAIDAGCRVGLVGRTGSGKSSCVHALLQLTTLASGGRVLLDGIDVADLAVDELRQRIAVCPQDCVLFSGSLRSNIDPFGVHSDEEILEVLDAVGLNLSQMTAETTDTRSTSTAGEDSANLTPAVDMLRRPIAENGGDLSGGEQQLLCLARVLLRCRTASVTGGLKMTKTKKKKRTNVVRAGAVPAVPGLIVFDEATSVMDHRTDLRIQQLVKTRLSRAGRTVLIIAHRLRSVIDADRVCVMASGRVVEFGSPHELLQREGGHFAALVGASGEEEELRGLAARKARREVAC